MPFPFAEHDTYTRALVNVSFDYAVKDYEKFGRRYVKHGYTVSDSDMRDHCYVNGDRALIAVEEPYENDSSYAPVENSVDRDVLEKYLDYAIDKKAYKRTMTAIPSAISVKDIRKYLYQNGFDMDGVY